MKKLLFALTVLLVMLAACGDDSEETGASEPADNQEENTDTEEVEETTESEETTKVSDTTLDTGDYIYEIKEIEQLDSKFDDGKQVLAIEMSFTNNTEEPASPWMSLGIMAEQETDTTVETLSGGNSYIPDDYKPEKTELWDTDIKPGATVDAVIAFEILYPGSPVRLYDSMAMSQEDVTFERIVETTE